MDEGPLLKLIKIENEEYKSLSEEDVEDANKIDNDLFNIFEIKVENLGCITGNEEQLPKKYHAEGRQTGLEDEKEIYPCIMCNFQSTSLQDVTEHISTHDRTGRFQCQFCDYQSNTKNEFDTHLRKHHKSRKPQIILRKFKCNECLFETRYETSLKRHYLRHKAPSEVNLFYCYKCSYKTRFKHNLKNHVLLHDSKNYKARTVGECATYYEKSFYNHYDYKFISKDKKKCLICGFTSNISIYVKKHMRRNHATEMGIESKVFQCFHCTFKTRIKYSLQVHLSRVHQKGVPFSPKKKERQSAHRKGDQYICEICRNFKSYHVSEIEVHKLSHDNIEHSNVFTCKLCDFKSIYKCNVDRHRRTHLPDQGKNIKCDMCIYSASRKDEMRGHILRCHAKQQKKNIKKNK